MSGRTTRNPTTTTPTATGPEADGHRSIRGRLARAALAGAVLVGLGGAALAQAGSPASALCKGGAPCSGDGGGRSTTTTAPAVTRVTAITPSFAWSGDAVTLSGSGFTGASVTVDGQSATITSVSSNTIGFLVPTITSTVVGPVSIPVVVTSPTGAATTSFTLSGTLQVSGGGTYGVNAKFGQGTDGSSSAVATIDRASGFSNTSLTVTNTQFWSSLSINVSTVWLDANNTVIGYTPVHNVTASGIVAHWPSSTSTASQTFTDTVLPNPGIGPRVHSAQMVFTRDHDAELSSTLQTAVQTGQTVYSVVSTLAVFV